MNDTVSPVPAAATRRVLGLPGMAWAGLAIAVAMQGICSLVVGVNAGMFFGGIVLAALIVPPMSLTEDRFQDRVMIAWVVNDAIGIVWFIAIFVSGLTAEQWFMCYLVLLGWTATLVGMTILIDAYFMKGSPRRDRRESGGFAVVAPAIATVAALAWISCPVWLARVMPTHPDLTHWIVWIHPLTASNSVVRNFGLWMERPIAYRYLLTLGQDVPAGLPQSVAPSTIFHFVLGIAGLALSRVVGRR